LIKSIAIGSFDGVHTAHQELISRADGVVVIERNTATLTAGYKRSNYTTKPMFFYNFDKIKSLTPNEFINKLRNDFPYLNKIIVGYDFAFGKNKSGNSEVLKELFDGEVEIVSEISLDNIGVHSKIIREFLSDGNIARANQFLGYEYQIAGTIIKGQGIGKNELVATINLSIDDALLPKVGIYASKTELNGVWYNSVSFIGNRMSTDNKFAVETHILDNDIGIVAGAVSIKFIEYIRENMKFENLTELKEQIILDINRARIINER
jgi:riboflavin kinase/FMN adenylyltransferase